MGISSSSVSHTTLSTANERRDWRIYADFAQSLIRTARPLYANDDLGINTFDVISPSLPMSSKRAVSISWFIYFLVNNLFMI